MTSDWSARRDPHIGVQIPVLPISTSVCERFAQNGIVESGSAVDAIDRTGMACQGRPRVTGGRMSGPTLPCYLENPVIELNSGDFLQLRWWDSSALAVLERS